MAGQPLPGPVTKSRLSTIVVGQIAAGPQGNPGPTGPTGSQGVPGQPAYTLVTAGYTQPAVNATVSVAVQSTSWMVVGQYVFVPGGGSYSIASIPDMFHVVLTNLGATGNASPSTPVSGSVNMVSAGAPGAGASLPSGTADTAFVMRHDASAPYFQDLAVLNVGKVLNVKAAPFNATGDGTTDDYAALAAAVTAAGSANLPLYLPAGTYKHGTSLTLPNTLHVIYANGAVLKPASASVAINHYAHIVAEDTQQIFDSAAVVNMNPGSTGKVFTNVVYAAWWGAKGDYPGGNFTANPGACGTDNTTALRSAIFAACTIGAYLSFVGAGGRVRLGRGQFRYQDSLTIDGNASSVVPTFNAAHTYAAGDLVRPTTANGFIFVLKIAASAPSTEPTWTTQINQTVVDAGGNTWSCLSETGVGASGLIIEGDGDWSSSGSLPTLLVADFAPEGSGSVAKISASSGGTGATITITGLTGMVSSDVGTFIFLYNCATAGNDGAYQILTVPGSTSVTAKEVTSNPSFSITTDNGSGGSGGSPTIKWVHVTREAIRFWSFDCVLKNVQITPADGRCVYSLLSDTESPISFNALGTAICSNNKFQNMRLGCLRPNTMVINAITHADSAQFPGSNSFRNFGDCENNLYDNVFVFGFAQYGFYSPNEYGQTYDLTWDNCTLGSSWGSFGTWGAVNPRCSYNQVSGTFYMKGKAGVGGAAIGIMPGICPIFAVYNLGSEALGRLLWQPTASDVGLNGSIIGGRIALDQLASDGRFIQYSSGGALYLQTLVFEGNYVANFNLKCVNIPDGGGAGISKSLTCMHCEFPNKTPFFEPTTDDGVTTRITAIGCQGLNSDNTIFQMENMVAQCFPDQLNNLVNGDQQIFYTGGAVWATAGPTGAYAIIGFGTGQQGAVIDFYTTIAQAVTFKHLNGSAGSGQKIVVSNAADISGGTPTAGGFVHRRFVYQRKADSGNGAWVVDA